MPVSRNRKNRKNKLNARNNKISAIKKKQNQIFELLKNMGNSKNLADASLTEASPENTEITTQNKL